MDSLAQKVGELLQQRGLTLGTVESATGGLIAHLITNVAGSSEYFQGSIVSYSNEIKMKVVKVKRPTLEKHGAVSHEVAKEMAEGGRSLLDVNICVADTGIAGPGGATDSKPLGLFYIGLSDQNGTLTRRHIFSGSRENIKAQAAEAALKWIVEHLTSSQNALLADN